MNHRNFLSILKDQQHTHTIWYSLKLIFPLGWFNFCNSPCTLEPISSSTAATRVLRSNPRPIVLQLNWNRRPSTAELVVRSSLLLPGGGGMTVKEQLNRCYSYRCSTVEDNWSTSRFSRFLTPWYTCWIIEKKSQWMEEKYRFTCSCMSSYNLIVWMRRRRYSCCCCWNEL